MYTEEYNDDTSYKGASYSDNFDNYDDYDYQEQEPNNNFWNENKGLIIKVAIIILCVVILIWLIAKLKGNDNNNNNNLSYNSEQVYAENVDSMRLASEKYFFIDGNLPKNGETLTVTLSDLMKEGLIGSLVDENKNACNVNNSYATIVKGTDSYTLTINLNCTGNSTPHAYYYSLESNNVCLNCTGFTYMDGTINNDSNSNNNDDTNVDDNENEFSCSTWSKWTTEKLNDNTLDVRTRILVKGIKLGAKKEQIVYGDWSEYTTDPITATDELEVESVVKKGKVWVAKTSSTPVSESDTIRNVTVSTTGGGTYYSCPSGYTRDGKTCYKWSDTKVGTLTYAQFNSYNVINRSTLCDGGPKTDPDTGKTIFKGCIYKTKITVDATKKSSSGSTIYSYEELTEQDNVTHYRSRTKTVETVYADPVISDYMEEKDLPNGYTKIDGTEKTEYSYKLKVCEK